MYMVTAAAVLFARAATEEPKAAAARSAERDAQALACFHTDSFVRHTQGNFCGAAAQCGPCTPTRMHMQSGLLFDGGA